MKSRSMMFAVATVVFCLGVNAYADPIYPLDYSTKGVVGTISGSDQQKNEDKLAQNLLNMGAGQTQILDGLTYHTSNTDYFGTIIDNANEVPYTGSGPITIAGNWMYALAKYDGPNAGYVLFYLPDYGNQLPEFSLNFWSNTSGEGYQMSHYTPFNPVPDGGSAMILLGGALMVLAGIRRFVK